MFRVFLLYVASDEWNASPWSDQDLDVSPKTHEKQYFGLSGRQAWATIFCIIYTQLNDFIFLVNEKLHIACRGEFIFSWWVNFVMTARIWIHEIILHAFAYLLLTFLIYN